MVVSRLPEEEAEGVSINVVTKKDVLDMKARTNCSIIRRMVDIGGRKEGS